MNYLILILAFLPIVVEVPIDKKLWKEGKNDKPLTTILRYIVFLGLATILGTFGVMDWWQAFILLVAIHATFFDAAINKFNIKKGIFYHPDTHWWDRIWGGIASSRFGKPTYVFMRLLILYTGWAIAFHWDWVMGDYPQIADYGYWGALLEFFKF